jgi:hypothetical protein
MLLTKLLWKEGFKWCSGAKESFRTLKHTDKINSMPALRQLNEEVATGTRDIGWQVVDSLIMVGSRVYVPPTSPCLQMALASAHEWRRCFIDYTLTSMSRTCDNQCRSSSEYAQLAKRKKVNICTQRACCNP